MNNKDKLNFNDILLELQNSDYSTILILLVLITTLHTGDKIISNYKLNKKHKPLDISKVILPPELIEKTKKVEEEKLLEKPLSDYILTFTKFMEENFEPDVLKTFYNNINTLVTVIKRSRIKTPNMGVYDPTKNKIIILEKTPESIFHELFHMSSSVYKDKIVYSGFKQFSFNKLKNGIAYGINEGYTQLLTERYFTKKYDDCYSYEKFIVGKLEEIVGKDIMVRLYFSSNLLGLINELKKYNKSETIMKFISDVDFISNYFYSFNQSKKLKKLLENSFEHVGDFIMQCYINKLKSELDSGNIELEEFIHLIAEFINDFSFTYKNKKYEFHYFAEQNSMRDFEKVLNYLNELGIGSNLFVSELNKR